jgi:hypothetical protein
MDAICKTCPYFMCSVTRRFYQHPVIVPFFLIHSYMVYASNHPAYIIFQVLIQDKALQEIKE